MKEHNYTIPINEALEAHVPCFLCKIEADLEKRALEYFMGAAVMEPAVRIAMNEKGFCRAHCMEMYETANKLPLALAMETRLLHIRKNLEKQKHPQKDGAPHGCAVCERVQKQMEKCVENALWLMRQEKAFLDKYLATDGVCVHHFYQLTKRMHRTEGALYKTLHAHMEGKLLALEKDLERFRNMFDYRSQDTDRAWAAEVLPRAITTLGTGKE